MAGGAGRPTRARVLALTFSTKAAEEMRARAEELLDEPYEELLCSTFHAFCARLLHEEALEGGFDPFFHPVTQADRLALLMDHADELAIRHHDLRGNPAPFFARIARAHRPAQGRDGHRRGVPALGGVAGRLAERRGARPEPSASSSSRASTATTTACSTTPARSTSAR